MKVIAFSAVVDWIIPVQLVHVNNPGVPVAEGCVAALRKSTTSEVPGNVDKKSLRLPPKPM